MIRFRCANCGEKLSVPDQYAGRKGKCPACQTPNRVPTADQAGRMTEIPFPPRAPARQEPAPAPAARTAPAVPAQQQQQQQQPTYLRPAPVQPPPAAAPAPAPAAEAPVPTINLGPAEITERPDRWTRGPLKIDDWYEDDRAQSRGWFGFLRGKKKPAEEEYRPGYRPGQLRIDREGMPMPVKVALFGVGVLALIGVVWGMFYLLLKLIILAGE